MNYGEADRILTVFTERQGKIKALAKGVRKISSKLAGNLEPFNLLQLEMSEGKTFFVVTSSEIAECFNCDKALSESTRAVYMAEIIDKVFGEGEKNTQAFEIFVDALRNIGSSSRELALRFYELKILEQAGFKPDFYHCASCNEELRAGENYLNNMTGALLCTNCGQQTGISEKIDDEIIKLLRLLQTSRIEICQKIKCGTTHVRKTEDILDRLLQNALEKELISKKYL